MRARQVSATACALLLAVWAASAGQTPGNAGEVTIFEGPQLIVGDGTPPIENAAFIVAKRTFSAIGRKGQNVRLASALIGSRIEIKSEQEVKGEVASALSRMLQASLKRARALADVPGVPEMAAALLAENGLENVDSIDGKTAEELAEVGGLGMENAVVVLSAVKDFLEAPLPMAAEEEDEESGEDESEDESDETEEDSEESEEANGEETAAQPDEVEKAETGAKE